jgi:hypothetical protein
LKGRGENEKVSNFKTILLTLILVLAALITGVPSATAHIPSWEIPTYAYIAVSPSCVGVGQTVYIMGWLDKVPPTALGAFGYRWKNITITVWKPDGSIEKLGPFISDPVGCVWTTYTPTIPGTYKVQLNFLGQILKGENLHPTDTRGREYIGDYFKSSSSGIVEFLVQKEPISPWPEFLHRCPLNTGAVPSMP